jgi:hypothetical protein
VSRPRKAGQPVYQKPKLKPKLRLVPSPEERQRPEPDTGLKEILNDMRRRYKVQHERLRLGDDDKDAA